MRCFIHGGYDVSRELLVEHHKWPTGFGGPDVSDNIILICASCHDLLHKIAEALYHKKTGKASDLAIQYLPNDPRRRKILLELANLVASKKLEYYEYNSEDVPDDPDVKEREIILSLAVPESLHRRLKVMASECRHGKSGRVVGLYRYCIEVLRAHVEDEKKVSSDIKVPKLWDI